MNQRTIAIVLFVPFILLTIYALMEVGYLGIVDYHRHSPAGWQVFADLVVGLILVLTWLVPEAKRQGHNPWPWVVGTLFTGSIAPLLYIIFKSNRN